MGYSQYFEVWPDALAQRLTSEPQAWDAFGALWGNCSGMHSWFDEFDQDDLEEIAEESSAAGVSRVRDLLAAGGVHPGAFLYKSLSQHEAVLRRAFADPGRADAAYLAIHGGAFIYMGSGFRVASHLQCQDLAERLSNADLIAAIDAFVAESDAEFPSADQLRKELDELRAVYRCAAAGGHCVITGVPWRA